MKLYPVVILIALLSLTQGCKGSKNQQASAPLPAPSPALIIDTDKDGVADERDPDDDNDGVVDTADRYPLDASEMRDADGDNQGDNADLDDDNDGLADNADAFPLDAKELKDSDNDGVGDNADADDDNDGIADSLDRFPLSNLEAADTDGDGLGNNADPDDDNDGVLDAQDALPLDAKETADRDKDGIGDTQDRDNDNDGVADSDDKFPFDARDARDFDADGLGDNADADDDNDGVADTLDALPLDGKEQTDTDGDGVGNNADDDDDNDGVADTKDKLPLDAKEIADFDGDGTGDNSDSDDDNDGISDAQDQSLGLITTTSYALSKGAIVKLSPSGTTAYVLTPDSKTITTIDLASGAPIKSITLAQKPRLMSVAPDGDRLFVVTGAAELGDFWTGEKIQVFTAADLNKVAEVTVNDNIGSIIALSAQQVLVAPESAPFGYLYDVAQGFQNYVNDVGSIHAFDAKHNILYSASGTVLSKNMRRAFTFELLNRSFTAVPGNETQLWLNPNGAYLISSSGRVINTDTLLKANELELAGQKITGVFFDSANNLAFLALTSGSVAVVRADTFEFIQINSVTSSALLGVSILGGRLVALTTDTAARLSLVAQPYDCPNCTLNSAPTAAAAVDDAAPETGQTVYFDAPAANDSDQDALSFRWDFNNDGLWDTPLSPTAKASYIYTLPGTFNATVQVVDAKGATSRAGVLVSVKQAKLAPIVRDEGLTLFDFPVFKGIFDGNDTIYYLDAANNRVHLVSLRTGKAERYFQFPFSVIEMFKSADLNKLYVVQHISVPQQAINSLITTIDTSAQVIEESRVVSGQFRNFAVVDATRFIAYAGEFNLIDRTTGVASRINADFSYGYFNGESGALYRMGANDLSRVKRVGDAFEVDKQIVKDEFPGAIGASLYLSANEQVWLGSNAVLPTSIKSDRYMFPTEIIKAIGDRAHNLVFAITSAGTVEVINSTSGQRIKTLVQNKFIRDVVVKGERLFLVVEVNAQQSALVEIEHPCLACAPNQSLAISILAPELKEVGKPITFSIVANLDEVINTWLFRWDLNGDGVWDGPFAATTAQQTTYALPGIKVISGQAKNAQGDTGKVTQVFEVAPGVLTAQAANNPSVYGRFNHLSIIAAVGARNIFLIADPQTRRLYFYDAVLAQITQELPLELVPETVLVSPDESTAYIQLVDPASSGFGGVNYERRHVMRIDLANYTITHSYTLLPNSGRLVLALSTERILTSDAFNTSISLLDSKTGRALSSLPYSAFLVSGKHAVLNDRIYVSVGSYISFANDTLSQTVFANAFVNFYDATWVLPGNRYILDAQGRKLDTTTLKIISTQPLPSGVYSESIQFLPKGTVGYSLNFGELVFFNFDTMQVIKRIPAFEARSAYIADGQLFTFGNSPSVRRLADLCAECADLQAPVAKLSVPVGPLDTSVPITLDASASSDAEQSPLSYRWDFNDDGLWDSEFAPAAAVSRRFVVPGSINVRVQVRDAAGNLAVASAALDVLQGIDAGTPVTSTRPFIFTDIPQEHVVDQVNGYLYYATLNSARVYILNLKTGLVERYFQFETRPQQLVISPDGKMLYLAVPGLNQSASIPNYIAAFDTATRAIVRTFNVPPGNVALAPLSENRVVITFGSGARTSVFDTTSGTKLADLPQSLNARGTFNTDSIVVAHDFSANLARYSVDSAGLKLTSEDFLGSEGLAGYYFLLSPAKTRMVFSNGVVYRVNDATRSVVFPTGISLDRAVFIDDDTLIWSDTLNPNQLRTYKFSSGVETMGVPCRCQSLFNYAGQAWAVKYDDSGNYFAAKVFPQE